MLGCGGAGLDDTADRDYSASPIEAFHFVASCNGEGGTSCVNTGTKRSIFYLRSAVSQLRDNDSPDIGATSGSLTQTGPHAGTASVTFSATDKGSGLYRAIVSVDGVQVSANTLNTNGGKCVDQGHAPGFDSAYVVPCPLNLLGAVASLDTTGLTEGDHTVTVDVEDAAGNSSRALTRAGFTVDNVAAPAATTAPTLTGTAQVEAVLTAGLGSWTNQVGALSFRFEACEADGSGCVARTAWGFAGVDSLAYQITPGDEGKRVRLAVQGRNAINEVTTAYSPVTAAVVPSEACATGVCGRPDNPPSGDSSSSTTNNTTSNTNVVQNLANGNNASRKAELAIRFAGTRRTVLSLSYGGKAKVQGRLKADDGQPIGGAKVAVLVRQDRAGAKATFLTHVTTGKDGTFEYAVPKGTSRALMFAYTAYSLDPSAATQKSLSVKIRAALSVKAAKKTKVGHKLSLSGKLRYQGRSGLKVTIQALDGKTWRTIGETTTRKGGTYKWAYRFKNRASAGRTFYFRARVNDPRYPFAGGTSKATKVRVTR
jgi:hypothetical protein